MSTLTTCSSCDGFVPAASGTCPHCAVTSGSARTGGRNSVAKTAARLAVGGAMAMTLMACYGAGPAPDPPPNPAPQAACAPSVDTDGDGSCPPVDCKEGDPTVHPGASDTPGDGIDQDCDGSDALP